MIDKTLEVLYKKLNIINQYLIKTNNQIKNTGIMFTLNNKIEIPEIETTILFNEKGFEDDFLISFNVCDLSILNSKSKYLTFKAKSYKNIFYVLFLIDNDYYIIALESNKNKLKLICDNLLITLPIYVEFANEQIKTDIDKMTNLFNKTWFQNKLKNVIKQYEEKFLSCLISNTLNDFTLNDELIGLIIFDIDNFKLFNDTYGHDIGDEVIIKVAELAYLEVKKYKNKAFIARFGGEEFVILTYKLNKNEAINLAENIRIAIESYKWNYQKNNYKNFKVTISCGIAFYNINYSFQKLTDEYLENQALYLFQKADAALYASKQLGKNKVTEYEFMPSLSINILKRRGNFVLIDAGLTHQINYHDRFEVYDNIFDGTSEIISPKSNKKIGLIPKMTKGYIEVSKDFNIFEKTLDEKFSVCKICNEIISIEPNDKCIKINTLHSELYNDDIFLSKDIFNITYYSKSLDNECNLSNFNFFLLISYKNLLSNLLTNNQIKNFLEKINEVINEFILEYKKIEDIQCLYLSTDKILLCFSNELSNEKINYLIKKILNSNNILSSDNLIISSLSLSDFITKPKNNNEIINFLRITNFIGKFLKCFNTEKNKQIIFNFNSEIYRCYAFFYVLCGKLELALNMLLECEKNLKQLGDYRLYQNIGILAFKLNNIDLAIKYLKMSENLDNNAIIPKSNLALIYLTTGKINDAIKYYRKCLKLEENNPIFLNNLAYCFLIKKKFLKLALKLIKKAIKFANILNLPNYLDTYAQILIKLNKIKDAIECYKKIIRLNQPNIAPIEIYINLIKLLNKIGNKEKALKTYEILKKQNILKHNIAHNVLKCINQKI